MCISKLLLIEAYLDMLVYFFEFLGSPNENNRKSKFLGSPNENNIGAACGSPYIVFIWTSGV